MKTVKRLMRSNVTASGNLNSDKFLRAMLQLRNTPDPDCGIAPSEIVFGKKLSDNLKFSSYVDRKSYSNRWQQAWAAKEDALRTRFAKTAERLNAHVRDLQPLYPGDACFIQNQTGNFKKKWHRTGIVMEVLPFDQYRLKVDGSSRLTLRNRRFLRKYIPFSPNVTTYGGASGSRQWSRQADKPDGYTDSSNPIEPDSSQQYSEEQQGGRINVPMPNDPIHHNGSRAPATDSNVSSPDSSITSDCNPPIPAENAKVPLCLRRIQDYLPAGRKEKPLNSRRRPLLSEFSS